MARARAASLSYWPQAQWRRGPALRLPVPAIGTEGTDHDDRTVTVRRGRHESVTGRVPGIVMESVVAGSNLLRIFVWMCP